MRLRAGVPLTVIAEIRSGRRVIGTVLLPAIGDIVTARRYRDRAIIIVAVVVITRAIIARPVVAVALRRERSANQCTGNRAREESATTATIAAVITVSTTAVTTAAESRATAISTATEAATTSATAEATTSATTMEASATTTPAVETATAASAKGSLRTLGETCGRRGGGNSKRHYCGGAQNLKIDHYRLHFRDIIQNLFERRTFPSLAPIVRDCSTLPDQKCTPNERIAPIPRQSVAAYREPGTL
jgi:hypothetical protein